MKTLIVYKSKHGAVQKAAHYMKEQLQAECCDVKEALSPEHYDAIVLIGSVYAGRLHKELCAYVRTHRQVLNEKRVYMAVSGLNKDQEEKVICENLGEDFYHTVQRAVSIGGILDFHALGFFEKKIINMVNKQAALFDSIPADGVVDMMDWNDMEALCEEITHA